MWLRGWTAEENRHGDLLNAYLRLTGRVDMRAIERTIHHLLRNGFSPRTEGDEYSGLIYAAFQERATRMSHGNLGKLASARGEQNLERICRKIAADETRHEVFYTRMGHPDLRPRPRRRPARLSRDAQAADRDARRPDVRRPRHEPLRALRGRDPADRRLHRQGLRRDHPPPHTPPGASRTARSPARPPRPRTTSAASPSGTTTSPTRSATGSPASPRPRSPGSTSAWPDHRSTMTRRADDRSATRIGHRPSRDSRAIPDGREPGSK